MPRRPLESISPNIIHRKELNAYERGIVVGQASQGATIRQISASLFIPRSTIHDTLINAITHPDGESKPRSGRPKATDDRDERTLLRLVRIDPKISYTDLIEQSGVQCSRSTVYRILHEAGITNWIMKKRLLLRLEDVKARYNWAKLYKDWTRSDWEKVIWSDESSVERGSGKKREWMFRTPSQKWHKEMIQPTSKGKDIKVMVWAALIYTHWRGILSRRRMATRRIPISMYWIKTLRNSTNQASFSCKTTPLYILQVRCVFGLKIMGYK